MSSKKGAKQICEATLEVVDLALPSKKRKEQAQETLYLARI